MAPSEVRRVAVYVRVSTQDQSCELQRNELDAYIAARGWTPYKVFEDHGVTGTNAKRPMLQALLRDARERRFDIVLVWKLDRFARSLKDLILMLQELSELGVTFVSLKDQLDLTTSAGRLMFHMLGAFAEFEASLIRERVRAGLRNAKAKGKRLGRPIRVDPQEARRLRQQGHSLREIALALGTTKGAVSKTLKKLASQIG